ncbi:YidC/Oxa1 family membrane protein insertase [Candidatus Chlorohelix sp.]|uniref:YidC/Oxa1 family membrane protein insertase n=1 Tax=Candidatus Chlorohelix sp. TaxID=3139201 RepID=UPI0030422C70
MSQIWDAIVEGMASIVKFFASLGGNNTAIGIILFTIAARLIILPLTLKAVRSSRAMQALQPEIKKINERYKAKAGERLSPEKAQAKQTEMMALYREYSVNPLASCLPVAIQIPIFFAVYGAVSKSIGTNDPLIQFAQNTWNQFAPDALAATTQAVNLDSSFLWIKTLKEPDPLYILPILMIVFQFATQRMAMPKGGGADDQQRRLNSIMQWMPIIFGFTALSFPSGPVIYWVASSIFSTVQQYFITGCQSLSDIPGLGWLPTKEIKLPQLEKKAFDASQPRKKTFMERMAEQQDKIASEKSQQPGEGTSIETAADAGKPISNNFGRKQGAGPITSKVTAESVNFEKGSGKTEEVIKEAYRQLSTRPPKKPANGRKGKK